MTKKTTPAMKAWAVAFWALATTGCGFQSYAPKPLDPSANVSSFNARKADSAEFQAYLADNGYTADQLPIHSWGVRELAFSALFFHPDLDVARAQWRASTTSNITAGERPLPGLSGGVEHHSDTAGGVSPWTYGLGIDLPIETAGKRQARIDRAASLSEAARIDIAQTAWKVRSRVISSWLAYSYSSALLQSMKAELGIRDEIVAMLEKRLQEGMVSSVEIANFRLQRQSALQAYQIELGRQAVLKAELASNAGISLDALNALPIETIHFPISAKPDPLAINETARNDLRNAALLNRLDLRASLSRYAAAEAKLRLEIARQYPDITLSPGYTYDQGDRYWSLGISALMTVIYKNRGLIAEATALRDVEGAQFEALQASIIGQLDQAEAAYRAAVNEMNKSADYLAGAESQSRQIQRQFDTGYTDRLVLRNIDLETELARKNLLAAHYKYEQAIFSLEEITQHPLQDDLALPADMPTAVNKARPGEAP